jgi:subfamily B ATP-binding cassette protein MsbA
MTVGAFVAFLRRLGVASQSLGKLANLQTVFAEGMSAARRLFAALDVEPEVRERAGRQPLPPARRRSASRPSASPMARRPPTLSDVSFEGRRGETVALVGPRAAARPPS